MRFPLGTREACSGAGCALLLTCILLATTNAMPQASADSSEGVPAKTGTATRKAGTTKKHRKPVVHSSSTKSGTGTTTHRVATKGKRSSRRRVRGQQKIDSERAQAIQEALIREHYLSGEATGTWNQASEDAMQKYQADHGWQSKTVPDSRALIKLGLGPSKEKLLNPESAMTTVPDAPRGASLDPTSHSADPGPPLGKSPATEPAPTSTPKDSSRPQ